MAWILTPALVTLRSNFNTRFPNRSKESDGSIGDWEHQQHTSSHNPDDTEGSKSEYSDTDTVAEVRAIDVDKDLNDPRVTMQMVINQILATPGDLKRLRYIIYNRTIWSKSNNWKPEPYDGVNPHTEHVHLNGDPLYDNASENWSVLEVGMAYDTPKEVHDLHYATFSNDAAGRPSGSIAGKVEYTRSAMVETLAQVKANGQALSEVKAELAEIKATVGTGGMDPAVLAQIVADEVSKLINSTRLTLG